MPKVVNKDDDDKSSPSPPPRQKEPIDLCDEDGVETEDVSPSAASSLMSSRKSNTVAYVSPESLDGLFQV